MSDTAKAAATTAPAPPGSSATATETLTVDEIKAKIRRYALPQWGSLDAQIEQSFVCTGADGCFLIGADGRRYLDMISAMFCSNLGHTNPEIDAAVAAQMSRVAFSESRFTLHEVRARLCERLASLYPGDLNRFYFCSSGAEANEAAIRVARKVTGRWKILSRYRAYHGATLGCLTLSGGDARAPLVERQEVPGIVHFSHVRPLNPELRWGNDEAEVTRNALAYLEDVVMNEGAESIAAILIEAVTSPANGLLLPPDGYLAGVQALCRRHGILLIADEVLAGWGRTGKLFSFMHGGDTLVPDIVTTAKGINGAYLPLGCMALRDEIGERFVSTPIDIGSTYNAHPTVLASSLAAVDIYERKRVVEHAAEMQPFVEARLAAMRRDNAFVASYRGIGLMWALETTFDAAQMTRLRALLLERGVFLLHRLSYLALCPPLVVSEQEMGDALDTIDKTIAEIGSAKTPAPAEAK